MSNENYNVEVKEEKCNCFCHSKGFRKFLVVATGSFVGVFLALSLFAALHKPPMPVPCPCGCHGGYHAMMKHPPRFDRDLGAKKGDFHKEMMKKQFEDKAPIKAEIDD